MINLLRTLFGIIFFGLIFGLAIIKNGPKTLEIKFSLPRPYPIQSYKDIIKTTVIPNKTVAFSIPQQDTLFAINFPIKNGLKLKEYWIDSQENKLLALHHSYQIDFSGQLFFFNQARLIDRLRSKLIDRLERTMDTVEQLYSTHRWDYKGITELPSTFYLSIEGDSDWESLEASTLKGFEQIKTLARDNDIPLQDNRFIIYPRLEESSVRWRAAIEVDRYYRTTNELIRCRRFRGGKSLELVHQGPFDFLKESWKILRDSLGTTMQAYPAMQLVNSNRNHYTNPLDWRTSLYLPILK